MRPLRWRMALRQTGQNGPLLGGGRRVSVALLRTRRVNHSACLARKVSTLSWPDSMRSSACSHSAVMTGSATSGGTASIKVCAAAEAARLRFFLVR
ncbi:hypothetical protein D3C81_1119260 [compost metagenome]